MTKKITILIGLIFFISCSNLVQNKLTEEQINTLNNFNISVKENLNINNFEYFEKNMSKNIENKIILNNLKNIDFSNKNIFISKINFESIYPFSVIGINIGENTFYFELRYSYNYHSKKWEIDKVRERR